MGLLLGGLRDLGSCPAQALPCTAPISPLPSFSGCSKQWFGVSPLGPPDSRVRARPKGTRH